MVVLVGYLGRHLTRISFSVGSRHTCGLSFMVAQSIVQSSQPVLSSASAAVYRRPKHCSRQNVMPCCVGEVASERGSRDRADQQRAGRQTLCHITQMESVHKCIGPLCMQACTYICMYICICVCMHVCIYVCMYVCIYMCVHVCMYVCMYVFTYVLCMYVCMHACMYVNTTIC